MLQQSSLKAFLCKSPEYSNCDILAGLQYRNYKLFVCYTPLFKS